MGLVVVHTRKDLSYNIKYNCCCITPFCLDEEWKVPCLNNGSCTNTHTLKMELEKHGIFFLITCGCTVVLYTRVYPQNITYITENNAFPWWTEVDARKNRNKIHPTLKVIQSHNHTFHTQNNIISSLMTQNIIIFFKL